MAPERIRAWVLLRSVAALLLAGLLAASAQAAEHFPSLPVQTLDSEPLQLPAALPECPVLLIVGFTRASSEQTRAWSRRLGDHGTCDTGVAMYQLVVTEGIPRMFRGMVERGIRKSVPEALRPRFLLVGEQAQRWRELLGYAGGDEACLMLLGTDRSVLWRHAGPPEADAERALQAALAGAAAP